MTYLSLEFPDEKSARHAFESADKHDMTGELQLNRRGEVWRLDLCLEENPAAPIVKKWGGKIIEEEGLDGRTYVALFGRERPIERKEEAEEVPAQTRRGVRRKAS